MSLQKREHTITDSLQLAEVQVQTARALWVLNTHAGVGEAMTMLRRARTEIENALRRLAPYTDGNEKPEVKK